MNPLHSRFSPSLPRARWEGWGHSTRIRRAWILRRAPEGAVALLQLRLEEQQRQASTAWDQALGSGQTAFPSLHTTPTLLSGVIFSQFMFGGYFPLIFNELSFYVQTYTMFLSPKPTLYVHQAHWRQFFHHQLAKIYFFPSSLVVRGNVFFFESAFPVYYLNFQPLIRQVWLSYARV